MSDEPYKDVIEVYKQVLDEALKIISEDRGPRVDVQIQNLKKRLDTSDVAFKGAKILEGVKQELEEDAN